MLVPRSFRYQLSAGTLFVLSLGGKTTTARAQTGTVVFDHVTVLPMTGHPRLTNRTVVIANGRIRAIGPAGSVLAPARAHHIDGRGRTLLPGLWDSQVHLLTLRGFRP